MKLTEHLEKLAHFIIAYESGTLKKASKSALVSQPQLTRTIKFLEEILDTELFIRSKSGISPTKSGEDLYNFAKQLYKETEKFEFQTRSNTKQIKGTIHIGAYDSISRYFFPDFIKYLNSIMPELEIILSSARSETCLKNLTQNKLDIAIIVDNKKRRHLIYEEIYSDAFFLYKSPQLQSPFTNTLIAFDQVIDNLNKIKKENGLNKLYSCENLETVMSLTLSGLGVGLLPKNVAKEYTIQGKLEPVSIKESNPHKIYAVTNKATDNPALDSFYPELIRFIHMWRNR